MGKCTNFSGSSIVGAKGAHSTEINRNLHRCFTIISKRFNKLSALINVELDRNFISFNSSDAHNETGFTSGIV